jgi:hypothetical protein
MGREAGPIDHLAGHAGVSVWKGGDSMQIRIRRPERVEAPTWWIFF